MANLTDSLARIGGNVAVGDVVAGKYRVEGLLGEGGMGVVLAARQVALDRLVALKLLPATAAKDQVMVGRFLREARAAARLQSDHVAKVIDVGTLPTGAPYMVMEHLDGADLGQVLAAQGRLAVGTACDYVVQACEAVGEAHAMGIVHRDLKPENLYLTTRLGGAAMIKVLDFGVSKMMTSIAGNLTTTSTAVGSPMYMAPEQMRASRSTDARADVWALGVVLYELLTQRCPFEAESLPDLCIKVVGEPPTPIAGLRPDLPPELVAIVQRCLEKEPERRFADATKLAAALQPFVPVVVTADASSSLRLPQSLLRTLDDVIVSTPPPSRYRAPLLVVGAALAAVVVSLALGKHAPPANVAPSTPPASAGTTIEPAPPAPSSRPPASDPPQVSAAALAPSPPRPSIPLQLRPPPRPAPPGRPADDIPAFR